MGKGSYALVLGLLLLQAVLLARAAPLHSPSIDEVGHLAAGLEHWQTGCFDLYRVNPPLVRLAATLPLLFDPPEADWSTLPEYRKNQEFAAGKDLIRRNGGRSLGYFTRARWACIPFALLGGLTCFLWARELYGLPAGFVALTLWCTCPMVLGNATMITPDVGAAATGTLAGWTFWRWLRSPGWQRALVAGLSLGVCELTKTTWVVLFGLWPLLWCVWRWRPAGTSVRRCPPGEAAQLLLILVLALELVNVGYLFEGSGEPLGAFSFRSNLLAGTASREKAILEGGNRFRDTWLGSVPVPLPRHYVLGIDDQKRDFEVGLLSYLRGEWRKGGWWYYYLYGLGVKVGSGYSAGWRSEWLLLAPVLTVLALVSSQTGFNHHVRYVLPVLPLVYVWTSKVGRVFVDRAWPLRGVVLLALAWSAFSSLRVYPHSLS
jgi:hypothetical protein